MFRIILKAPNSLKGIFFDDFCYNWSNISNISSLVKNMFHDYPNYIYYNDEVPHHNIGSNYAHAKGVLSWNNYTISWLIHSYPNWPMETLDFPTTKFGQSFIHLTLPIALLSKVLAHLKLMNVYVYKSTFDLSKLIISDINIDSIQLFEEESIYHIAKNAKWDKDIFDDYLVSLFGCNIFCESWMRPICKDTEHVDNVTVIQWPNGIRYNETQDHSKYAFSINSYNPWVYIGDLNHTTSQSHRGGGGVLIKHPLLWDAFYKLVYKD